MSARPNPPLKSLPVTPTGTGHAKPALATLGRGAAKVVARQGVLSSVRPDPRAGDSWYASGWLHVVMPPRSIPTATSVCDCGHNRSAVGRHQVLALVEEHTDHRTRCPLRTTKEGIAA